MKKLILFILGLCFTVFALGQSLLLSDTNNIPYTAGQTIQILGDTSSANKLLAFVYCTNVSNSFKSVKVSRTEDQVLPGVEDDFCWAGVCYAPGTSVSALSQPMDPGQTNTEFEAGYIHHDVLGESTYTYTWFDENNISDAVSITVVFKLTALGMYDNILEEIEFSKVYPNPANNNAYTDINISQQLDNVTLVISNLLGAVIKEIPVSGGISKIRINTTDLKNGLYFASLKVNQGVVNTKRFVVNH